MENSPKPRYKSKTYGLAALLAVFALAIFGLPELQAVVEAFPAEYQATILFAIGMVTAILREFTKVPIGPAPTPPDSDD